MQISLILPITYILHKAMSAESLARNIEHHIQAHATMIK
jgi:hypothetical protein